MLDVPHSATLEDASTEPTAGPWQQVLTFNSAAAALLQLSSRVGPGVSELDVWESKFRTRKWRLSFFVQHLERTLT